MAAPKDPDDRIQVASGREDIRKRPGMYIGSTGPSGVEHLVWELVSNAADQVLAGRASQVRIVIHNDDSVEVIDNGPGIDLLNDEVRSYFEILHRSPTADAHTPHIHLAATGLGAFAANVLSSRFEVTTQFGNQTLRSIWTDGAGAGGTPEKIEGDRPGTSVRMWLDPTILDDVSIRRGSLDRRIHELNALIPMLDLTLSHEGGVHTSKSGMTSLLVALFDANRHSFNDPHFLVSRDESDPLNPIDLQIVFSPTRDGDQYGIAAFCNFHRVREEGEFIRAIRSTMWRVGCEAIGATVPATPESTAIPRVALVASITMLAPEVSGPTRGRLDDPRSVTMAQQLISAELPKIIAADVSLQQRLRAASTDAASG